MKIAASEIANHSARSYTESHQLFEKLRVFQNGKNTTETQASNLLTEKEPVNLSEKAQLLQAALKNSTTPTNPRIVNVEAPQGSPLSDGKSMSDLRLQIIRAILESLTGEKMELLDGKALESSSHNSNNPLSENAPSNAVAVDYRRYEIYTEHEKTNFYAAGKVLTEDGVEINFNLSLSMERSFHFQSAERITMGNTAYLTDPLVINLNAPSSALQRGTFAFDLNADGEKENIHVLNQGSGFLVLDKNEDGKINDGTEMFGTKSGNGFLDLAQYDEDQNGWIDENDSIYEKLGVWSPDESGNGVIQSLKYFGVGAIALNYANTEFALKNEENALAGKVRATGVFLKENGEVGTMQQVDLKAEEK